MRILIRTSKLAIWARRLGAFALPLALLPVLLHRERVISSDEFLVIETAAAGFALLAFILAISAYARLWVSGDRGWVRASIGLLFSLICLLPMGVVAWLALHYPVIGDVSTDDLRPPQLVGAVGRAMTGAQRDDILAVFPNARTRSYPIEAQQMFGIVEQLALASGWELRARRAPTTPFDVGQLNLLSTSLLGWRDEVVLRVSGLAAGSTVDMRSTPTHGWFDLGENGRRVESFLLGLDNRVTLLLRDAPQAPTTPTDPTDAPPVTQDEDAEE